MANENSIEMQQTWESRKETLDTLYKRFKEKSDNLDAFSAIVFSNPLVTMLLSAVGQLETHEEQGKVDLLLHNVLNVQERDAREDASTTDAGNINKTL